MAAARAMGAGWLVARGVRPLAARGVSPLLAAPTRLARPLGQPSVLGQPATMGVLAQQQLVQARGMAYLSLNNLRDVPGARRKAKRVGRGPGSGLGKTAGRGMKGQKARSGNKGLRGKGFEGGQTPLHRRVPKWGFTNNKFKENLVEINVGKVQQWIDRGRLDPAQPINMKALFNAHAISRNVKDGVKLLGNGTITTPVFIEVTRASKSAIAAVEAAGGTLVTAYYNKIALRAHLKPNKYHPLLRPKRARPPTKKRKYYVDYENRGYLSPEMQLKLRELNIPQPAHAQQA